MLPLRVHTAICPGLNRHILSTFHPTASAVTFAKLAHPRPSTTPRSAPLGEIPLQAHRRAVQLSKHFSTSASVAQQEKDTIMAPSVYTTRKVGAPHTLEHRIFLEKDGVPVVSRGALP